MVKNNKAVLIGTTNLLIECAKILLANAWGIIQIASDDNIVIQWAKKNKIKVIPIDEYENVEDTDFVLFSIINRKIIRTEFLNNKKIKYAINYHDSLLPSYAGLNSTIWAIINQEKFHGCTWHLVDKGIDTGNLLLQSKIEIEVNETAFSLNLKCAEHAIKLFNQLILNFEETIQLSLTQTKDGRSYYGQSHIPQNYGILNRLDEKAISLINGLNVGRGIANEIAVAKVFYNEQFHIVNSINGQTVQLTNIYGEQQPYQVEISQQIEVQLLNQNELAQIEVYKKAERSNINELQKYRLQPNKLLNIVATSEMEAGTSFNCKTQNTQSLLTAISISLANLLNMPGIIALYSKLESTSVIDKIFNKYSLLDLGQAITCTINEYTELISKKLKQSMVLSKDALYRYNMLDMIPDIAITIGNNFEDLPISHCVVIKIEADRITFKYPQNLRNFIDYLQQSISFVSGYLYDLSLIDQKIVRMTDVQYLEKDNFTSINATNDTEVFFDFKQDIYGEFLTTYHKMPTSQIAIIDSEGKYTYSNLYNDATILASHIASQSVITTSDPLIAIQTARGRKQVLAMLGIFKAARAYLPLHPDWPTARVEEIMLASNCKLLIVDQSTYNNYTEDFKRSSTIKFLILEKCLKIGLIPTSLIAYQTADLNDIAYVIFTSGSTGKPKGVTISHRGALNTIYAINQKFNITEKDAALAISEISFDLSVYDIWGMLIVGGCIIFPSESNNILSYIDLIEKYDITIWNSVPQIAHLFIDYLTKIKGRNLTSLKLMLLSGDWVHKDTYSKFSPVLPNCKIYSLGGATEASIWSIWHEMGGIDLKLGYVPYGTALPNQKMYVLNNLLNELPLYINGEIYIGGDGVALNYWRDNEKTTASFINHPKYGRIYKTGDMGSFDRCDNQVFIKFMGRNDNQVKINGFRIELEEISQKIQTIAGIEQAIVTIEKQSNQLLVAYFIANEVFDPGLIKNTLVNLLPHYMIPSFYIQLDAIPLTANGKIDIKALPLPDFKGFLTNYRSPQGTLEVTLANIICHVLDIAKISADDNIFKIGANSISAIKITHDIELFLNKKISIADVFEYNTIAKLAALLEVTAISQHIQPVGQLDYIPSYQQSGLYFIEKSSQISAYAIPLIIKLNDNSQLEHFKRAIIELVNTNDILRSVFYETDDGQLRVKTLLPNNDLNFIQIHCPSFESIERQLATDVYLPFDLTKSVVNYHVYEAPSIVIMLNFHHIVFDGWSIELFLSKLNQLVSAKISNQVITFTKPALTYSDFSNWQNNFLGLNSSFFEEQFAYWEQQLAGVENLDMYKDYKISVNNNLYAGGGLKFDLGIDTARTIKRICKEYSFSEFSLLSSVFAVVLQKYSASAKEVVFGIPSSGRNSAQLNDVLGYFVNSLTIRLDFTKEITMLIKDFIFEVQNVVIQAQKNMDIPFTYLVEKMKFKSNGIENPIFQYMFSVQSFTHANYDHFSILDENEFYKVAKFYFNFTINDKSPAYTTVISYSTSLYTIDTINRIAESYKFVLKQFIEHLEDRTIAHIQTVLPSHYQNYMRFIPYTIDTSRYESVDSLLMKQGDIQLPSEHLDKYLHQVFIENAISDPEHIAVTDETGNTSYGELLCHVSQVRQYIEKIQIEATEKEIIAVLLPKSYKQPSACLAITAAGYAYLPLNLEWPAERIKIILKKAKVKILLCNDAQSIADASSLYSEVIEHFIDMDQFDKRTLLPIPKINIPREQIAYVIFTSGSTGEPKGCMLSHKGVMNTNIDINYHYNIDKNCAVLALADLSFDQSVYDIFGILTAGARIVYPDNAKRKDPSHWWDLCNLIGINLWNSVPMLISMFIEYIETLPEKDKEQIAQQFRFIMLSGEAFPLSLVKPILNTFKSARLVNSGGATECSIWSIWYEIKSFSPHWHTTPYGYAMANQRLYVLDQNFNFCPTGVIGELFIGGIGVGLGYLNNPEKTAEAFIWCEKLQQRLYRTGDLVKIHQEGHIDFVSRKDFQVKVNGYRIELGEIEYHLDSLPGIKLSAVIVKDGSITAYLEVENDTLDEIALLGKLNAVLPPYMVPKQFIILDALPRSANGKVDKKDLQARTIKDPNTEEVPKAQLNYKLNKFDQYIYTVWKEVLTLEEFDLNNSFFDLGGNSLTAMKMIARLNRKLGIDFSILNVFKQPQFLDFTCHIINEVFNNITENEIFQHKPNQISDIDLKSASAISHAQKRILNLEQELVLKHIPLHNVPVIYHLRGKVNIPAINYTLNKLIQKHSILRTVFKYDQEQYTKRYLPYQPIELTSESVSDVSFTAAINAFNLKPFNVFNDELLIRFKLYQLDQDYYVLAINQHHLIADGWAIQLLNQEFLEAYKEYLSFEDNTKIPIITEEYSYQKYINTEHGFLNSAKFSNQLNYWLNRMAKVQPLRLDNWLLTTTSSYQATTKKIEFTADISQKLEKLSIRHNKSLYSLMLSGFYLALGQITNNTKLSILAGVSGRFSEQFEQMLGMFVNGVILSIELNASVITFFKLWEEVFNECSNGYNNQEIPLDIVLEELSKKNLLNIPDITFLMNSQNNLFAANTATHNFNITYEYPILPFTNFTLQVTVNNEAGILSITTLAKDIVPPLFIDDLLATFQAILKCVATSDLDTLLMSDLNKFNRSFKLLPYQDMFWFDYCKDPKNNRDVICMPFIFRGPNADNDINSFMHGLKHYTLQQHTHVFGIIAETQNGQYFFPDRTPNFENFIEYSTLDMDGMCAVNLQITRGEFFKVYVSKLMNETQITVYFHHLIYDMVSHYKLLTIIKNTFKDFNFIHDYVETGFPAYMHSINNKIHDKDYQDKARQSWQDALGGRALTINFPMRSVAKYNELGSYEYFEYEFPEAAIRPNFSQLMAIYCITLRYITNQSEISLIYPKNIRDRSHHDVSGSLINLVPLTLNIASEDTISEVYKKLIKFRSKNHAFDNYPLMWLINDFKQNSEFKENLLNVGFLETHILNELDHMLGENSHVSYKMMQQWKMKLDFALEYEFTKAQKFTARVHYRNGIFSKHYVEKFINCFKLTIDSYIGQQNINYTIADFDLKDMPDQSRSIMHVEYPNLVNAFIKSVQRFPSNIAVSSNDLNFTYAEIDEFSNYVAYNLLKQANRGDRIILLIKRSAYIPIFILGILKAGMIYVPVDPSSPEERKEFIIADCKAKLIISDDAKNDPRQILPAELLKPSDSMLTIGNSNDPAYIIYTSGTTGKPKGTIIYHRSVTALITSCKELIGLNSTDIWSCFHSIAFDFSIWEIFGALLTGGRLEFLDQKYLKNTELFWQVLKDQKVTILSQTPTAFKMLSLIDQKNGSKLDCLRTIVFGGEVLKSIHLEEWVRKYSCAAPRLINMYGITEATVHSSFYTITEHDIQNYNIMPIGTPQPHVEMYLLNEELDIIDSSQYQQIGEIYIGGISLAAGYWNKSALTDERFKDLHGKRLYKSGDLAFFEDNKLFCIGRNDNQVKIRGYRIELAEVNNAIANIDKIKDFVLIVDDNDCDKEMVLFVRSGNMTIDELKSELQRRLPLYMVPSKIFKVDNFVYNTNGKIDKQFLITEYCRPGLNQPPASIANTSNILRACPEEMQKLLTVWEEVLGTKAIHPDISFLAQGGTSYKAVALMVKIAEAFEVKISLMWFFAHQTLNEQLVDLVNRNSSNLNTYTPLKYFYKDLSTNKKLFMIHPGHSGAEAYHELAKHLKGNGFSIYGIESYNIYHSDWVTDLTELAESYLKVILSEQSDGNFYIGGWSFGGLMAFEVARLLKSQGMTVKNIFIIDTKLLCGIKQEEIDLSISNSISKFRESYVYKLLPADRQKYLTELIRSELLSMHMYKIHELAINASVINATNSPHNGIQIKKWDDYLKATTEHFNVEGDHFSIMSEEQALKQISKIIINKIGGISE